MTRYLISIVQLLFVILMLADVHAADQRAYQHGVDFVYFLDGSYRLFWSSAPGTPPAGEQEVMLKDGIKCEYFIHDIYATDIKLQDPRINPTRVVALPEAQEPVSATSLSDGLTLLTFEDGSESDITRWCDSNVQQRYQLFDAKLHPVTGIERVSVEGGHSGHVATIGNNFVISYAEGWIDGGGVDDAGTADDIHVDVVDSNGQMIHHHNIAVDDGSQRDWWPLIAGSPRTAMLVWQRFVEASSYAELMFSVYDPVSDNIVTEATLLHSGLVYYHYDVQYLSSIDRFLVIGNFLAEGAVRLNGGEVQVRSPSLSAYLLDVHGRVVAQLDGNIQCENCAGYHNYTIVRESQPAMNSNGESVELVYPVKPRGVIVLQVTSSEIHVGNYIDTIHYWFPLGTDGIYLDRQSTLFVNLTPTGIRTVRVPMQR